MSMRSNFGVLYIELLAVLDMADQVQDVDASTSSSVSHNSSFSFDADVSGTSSLDTCETDSCYCFSVSRFLTSIMGLSSSIMG